MVLVKITPLVNRPEEITAYTLEEIGEDFNVTRERIRQLEAIALNKLKHPIRSGKLRTYVEGSDDQYEAES